MPAAQLDGIDWGALRAAPPGATWDQVPLVNRLLGSRINAPDLGIDWHAVCPTMDCVEGPCETFWRPDRPRAYVAAALIAGAAFGVYKLATKKRRR